MRLHVLQHVPFEGLAKIGDWADKAGHTVTATRLFAQDPLPDVDALDMLVIMGGPMGANDDETRRWMKGEKQCIERAIRKEKKVLGVCLGAQLIARVLGARVYPNAQKEIGWFPLELNVTQARHHALHVLPPKMTVFHWHGDTFDLPVGAVPLAHSQACENQAFAVGRHVVGLQFHLEMGMPQIESLLRHAASDLTPGNFVMAEDEILDLAPSLLPPLNASLVRFLDAFSQQR